MDAVFQALAHADRRRILDLVKDEPGRTVGSVCGCFGTSRVAVLKHIGVLEEAGLLVREKAGRRRLLYVNSVPIQQIHERWTTDWSRLWAGGVTSLKYKIESGQRAQESDEDGQEGGG